MTTVPMTVGFPREILNSDPIQLELPLMMPTMMPMMMDPTDADEAAFQLAFARLWG